MLSLSPWPPPYQTCKREHAAVCGRLWGRRDREHGHHGGEWREGPGKGAERAGRMSQRNSRTVTLCRHCWRVAASPSAIECSASPPAVRARPSGCCSPTTRRSRRRLASPRPPDCPSPSRRPRAPWARSASGRGARCYGEGPAAPARLRGQLGVVAVGRERPGRESGARAGCPAVPGGTGRKRPRWESDGGSP